MRYKRRKRPVIRKRSFLLFELMVSLALIALCLFPLIRPHVCMRKADMRRLEELQLDILAQQAFCCLKIDLYEHKIYPWERLSAATGTLAEPLTNRMGKDYTCNYVFSELDSSVKQNSSRRCLAAAVALNFSSFAKPAPHSHRSLYLERKEG